MEIDMEDFFYGFIRRYKTFGIEPSSNATKWTNKILGYFEQLGLMLGARTEYELMRYDLAWFCRDEDEVWLHVEHENKGSWAALEDTIRKLDESTCEDLIAIIYPASEELGTKFIQTIRAKMKGWTEDTELLVIIDASYYRNKIVDIHGHYFKGKSDYEVYKAAKKIDETGLLYAILL